MEKRIRKHVRSTIFVLLLLLGAFFVVAPDSLVAAQDGDYTYTVSSGVATITGYTGAGGAITIPSTLGGYPTVAIGDGAFNSRLSLTSVTIPNSVISIGNYTFQSCWSMTSVTIPNSVTSIGPGAFFHCASLTSVVIPNSITSIENFTFQICTALTSVTIPDSITSIGFDAFYNCTSLASVAIPSSVTSIGGYAFSDCTFLDEIDVNAGNPNYASIDGVLYDKTITTLIQYPGGRAGAFTIPSSIISLGDGAFASCTTLTSVVIPSGVTSIGNSAFSFCTSLTSVILPSSVTSIGIAAFEACHSLASVTIPSSVTSIGYNAFISCNSLASVAIPSSVASIGEKAFAYCTSLTAIDVNAANANYASVDGVLYNKTITTLIQYPGGRAGAFAIPSSVTSIGSFALSLCTALTSVTTGNGVTSIGQYTFWFCTALSSVAIGNSVTYIGFAAFWGCTSLTSITFLGLVAPTTVGLHWIKNTDAGIRGHAYAASNFPAPGNVFYGLTMGAVITIALVAPDVPTDLTATPGNAQVVLAWHAPAVDGGSAITGYKLYRSTASGGTYSLIASPSGLTYTDTGLTNGQTYWYKVSAVNAIGVGANCTAVSVLVPQPVTPANDYTMLILVLLIAIGMVLILLFVLRKRKK